MPLRENAELNARSLADLCLARLAEAPEELAQFMAVTGYSPQSLRTSLDSDQLAHGLIDYVAQNEPLMLAVCANANLKPEAFMRIWHKLNPQG